MKLKIALFIYKIRNKKNKIRNKKLHNMYFKKNKEGVRRMRLRPPVVRSRKKRVTSGDPETDAPPEPELLFHRRRSKDG